MSQQVYDPGSAGERWSVNMPAVIVLVFAALVGIVIWVVASGDGDDGADESSPTPTTAAALPDEDEPAAETTTPTTTPVPLPSTTEPGATTTTSPGPPVTTAPGAEEGAVPGDLAIAGRPMQRPPCEESYITVLASAVGADASANGISSMLEAFPGSNYLRTDQTCQSLTQDVEGDPIYVVYFGPFAFDSDACAARADGPSGAYARVLSNDVGPDHSVACP